MIRAAGALAAAVLLLAGCGSDEEVGPQVGLRAASGSPAPAAAEIFEAFLAAAGRGDTVAMWELLSEPTQASLGPTLDGFRAGAAAELEEGAGSLSRGELVLARAFGSSWAVAAVAGEVEREGEREHAAYAAALRREAAGWRLELDGIFFVSQRPGPAAELDDDEPLLGATAQSSGRIERMVLWLDGEAVGARATRPQPFTGTIAARPLAPVAPGVHIVTVFAATAETAAAYAWSFEVEP